MLLAPGVLLKTIPVIVLFFGSITLKAQNASISGQITDLTGTTITGITVVLDGTLKGAATDANGQFTIDAIKPGNYMLIISGIGYHKQTRDITLIKGQKLTLNVKLEDSTIEMDEVVVRGESEAQRVERQGFTVNSIETKKFENTALDINQILGQTTGVRIRETGGLGSDFNFFLNGLSGRQVRFFLDGLPLENYGSVFNLNNIPANLIERVDIYKGVVPIHLGADALGGAIDVVTKQNAGDYLDVSYSYGSFNTHRANLSAQWRNPESGLTIRPQAFYNYSDNNYTMRNLQTQVGNEFITGDFERFHDSFRSKLGSIEVGFTQVPWADQLMVGVGYGTVNKDIQTASRGSRNTDGSFSIPVVGEAFREEDNTRYTLRYVKENLFNGRLNVNVFASYNLLNSFNVDSSSNRYNWNGDIIRVQPRGELIFAKSVFRFEQQMFQTNVGVNYDLSDHHRINASFTWSTLEREGRNIFNGANDDSFFEEPNTLDKKVLGISYRLSALDGKLETTAFGKAYNFDILARKSVLFSDGAFSVEDLVTNQLDFGYGAAMRYLIGDNLSTKASYERAYRLPEAFEIFGDGLLTLANPEIKPESSNNINAGLSYQMSLGNDSKITYEGNGFIRWVEDIIFPVLGGPFIAYENLQQVYIRGIEAEIRYQKDDRFQVGVNATYQDVLDDEKINEGTQIPNITYRERMYNTPYFFANGDISYGIPNVGRGLKLSFFYNTNYVHEFYLNYPNIARAGDKFTVPTQFLHHIGTTLSTENDRYNITVEVRNFTNALAYDNFALQRPGRAFYVNLRYFINSYQ